MLLFLFDNRFIVYENFDKNEQNITIFKDTTNQPVIRTIDNLTKARYTVLMNHSKAQVCYNCISFKCISFHNKILYKDKGDWRS